MEGDYAHVPFSHPIMGNIGIYHVYHPPTSLPEVPASGTDVAGESFEASEKDFEKPQETASEVETKKGTPKKYQNMQFSLRVQPISLAAAAGVLHQQLQSQHKKLQCSS
jgi:hypothetical protein